MKYILSLFLLVSCMPTKQSDEMELLGKDVLKAKTGLDIKLEPIKEDAVKK